jgi:hypothetical protein
MWPIGATPRPGQLKRAITDLAAMPVIVSIGPAAATAAGAAASDLASAIGFTLAFDFGFAVDRDVSADLDFVLDADFVLDLDFDLVFDLGFLLMAASLHKAHCCASYPTGCRQIGPEL